MKWQEDVERLEEVIQVELPQEEWRAVEEQDQYQEVVQEEWQEVVEPLEEWPVVVACQEHQDVHEVVDIVEVVEQDQ